ncbi:MAG: arylesterase [Bacteroidota bacterium]
MKLYVYASLILFLFWACSGPQTSQSNQKEPSKEPSTEDKMISDKEESSSVGGDKKIILIFGNSLTAGYGLDNPEDGFAGLIQLKLENLDLPYEVVNGGISGETSSDGKGRIKWMMRSPVDIFVLELGANDGLRGISPEVTQENLQVILTTVKESYPEAKILITGMEAPPNMGDDYTEAFRKIFPALAEANDAELMPFLLEGVAGEADLNQSDAIHPTEEGHEIVAENLWTILKKMIEAVN